MKLRRSGIWAALLIAALSLATAAPALADNAVPLGGSPLNVYVGERGQLQAVRTDTGSGIFYRSTDTVGDAGFFLAFPSGYPGEPSAEGVRLQRQRRPVRARGIRTGPAVAGQRQRHAPPTRSSR